MPGPIIRNPTPEWMKAKNASVLDPAYKKIARTLAQLVGLDDPQSQVLGMMTPLVPEGQATLSKPLQKMGNTLADLVEGIKAYHGSPHDFDKFSLSKIGTGEGAQAYGRGLYFAENKEVAEGYREALTTTVAQENLNGIRSDLMAVRNEMAAEAKRRGLPMKPAAWGTLSDEAFPEEILRDFKPSLDNIKQALAQAEDYAARTTGNGRLYEVNITADPSQLLDWDAPIASQSPAVQKVASQFNVPPDAPGRKAHGAISEVADNYFNKHGKDPQAVAAGVLRRNGIPGIKYLDGNSRVAGEGSRNFVIFDDSLVSILKKYGVALPVIEGLRRKASANGGRLDRNDVEGLF